MLFRKKKKAGAELGEEQAEDAAPPPAEAEGESPAAEAGVEGEGAPRPKRKKKIIIIAAAAVLLLLIIGGAAAYFLGVFSHKEEAPAAAPMETGDGGAVYYTLPEFLVNLNTTSKQSSFLKMTIVLQIQNAEDAKKVEAALPRVLDNMNTYLREMRATDLSGSAGIYRLREELLVRVNKTVSPVRVTDVLFKEIIVQ